MKSFLRKIPPFLFAIWTFGIMTAYFYFYQNYGQFYLDAFVLILLLAAFFVPIIFFASLPFLLRGKPSPVLSWLQHLPPTFFVPVKSLVVIFYGCIASWILLIYLLKPDIGISLNSALSVSLVTLITLAGFSIGSRLIRRFHIETDGPLERFVLSTLLGFGVLMFVVYIAGMVGLLYRIPAYTLVFGALFFFRREWLSLFSDIKKTALPWKLKPFFTFDNFAIAASALLSVFAMTGLLSQFAAGWDEMHTYQAFPHAYAEAHRIVDFKYWFASGFPQNTEMLYTLAHLLKGFTPAAGLNTVFYFLLPGILMLIKRLAFPKASSPVVVLLYALSAIPYLMITVDHKIDLAFWCYTLLATLYLLKFFQTPERKTFLLFAILSGIAADTKYNFFSIILPSFLVVLFFFPREFNFQKRLAHIAATLAIITLCFSPWAVKNIIFSGNPVEPALGDLLSRDDTFFKQIGRSYSEHLREQFSDANIWAENQDIKDWKFYITFPFRLTFNYREALTDIINIGPIYLIFLPVTILFFIKKELLQIKERPASILATITLLQFISWFFLSNLFPWYTFSTLLTVNIFATYFLRIEKKRTIKILISISIIALSLSTFFVRFDSVFRSSTIFVRETNGEYPLYETAKFINENNLNGLIWTSPGPSLHYYTDHSESRIVYDYYLLIFNFLEKNVTKDEISLEEKLKSIGVSYFVFNDSEIEYLDKVSTSAQDISPQSSKIFKNGIRGYLDFRNNHLTEIFRSEDIAVYTFQNEVECTKKDSSD